MKMLSKLCLVVFCLLLVGCSSEGGRSSGEKDTLRIWIGGDTESMDPGKMSSTHSAAYAHPLFEGLTRIGKDGMPQLAAADKYEVSEDGLTYVFHLRDNFWHNGDPVRAQDFVYAYRRILNPKFASVYAYMLYMIKGAEEYNSGQVGAEKLRVRALDDKTLEIVLKTPTPYFLSALNHHSFCPVNPKVVQEHGDWATKVETLIGNGGFKIDKWVRNNKMELVKHDKYWDQANVKSKKIIFYFIDNALTAQNMFDNNELDFKVGGGKDRRERLKKEGKLYESNNIQVSYFTVNNKKGPFSDPRLRRAISYAMDRQKTINVITQNAPNKAAFGLVPYGIRDPQTGKDFRQEGGDLFHEDMAKAQALLAEAGYPGGKGLPPITLLTVSSQGGGIAEQMLQERLKNNLGVILEIHGQEWKVFLASKRSGKYDMVYQSWVGDYMDPMSYLDLFTTGNANNNSGYSNPEYDRLIFLAQKSGEQKVRMAAMHQAEKILMEEMGVIPDVFGCFFASIDPKVKGYINNGNSIFDFQYTYKEA